MLKKPIVLIGMPAAGKSTHGIALAKFFDAEFADTDEIAELRLGQSIREYFALHGEEAFRDLEKRVFADLFKNKAGIISTGGGIILRKTNRELMRENTFVIYLHATPSDLYKRLQNDCQRPLLQVEDPLQKLQESYERRKPLYQEVAHMTVETENLTSHEFISLVVAQLSAANLLEE